MVARGSIASAGALLAALLVSPIHARAGGDEPVYRETIVVTATGDERAAEELPQPTSAVGDDQLRRQPTRSAAELLRDTPGVWVQQTGASQAAPILRGLVGNQVLHLIDGVRLNNATYRFGPNQYLALVDPFSLRRIEVVRGPMSVLYGSDALGGVVQVLTSPADEAVGAGGIGGRLIGQWGSADLSAGARSELSTWIGGRQVSAGITGLSFGELRAGGGAISRSATARTGRQPQTDFGAWGGELLIESRSEAADWAVGVQSYGQSDADRTDAILGGRNLRWSLEPQRRDLIHGRYQRLSTGGISDLKLSLSFQQILDGSIEQRAGSTIVSDDQFRDRQLGLGLQLQARTVAGHRLTFGGELSQDWIASSRTERDGLAGRPVDAARPRYPDGSAMSSLAGYVQDEWQLSRRLGLVLGARWSRVTVDPGVDPLLGLLAETFTDLTGSAAWVVRLTDQLRLVGGVGRGFRAPNLDDLAFLGQTGAGFEVPNAELRPESLIQLELGLRRLGARGRWELRVFRSHLRDLIVRTRSTYLGQETFESLPVYTRSNTGTARIDGVEASAAWIGRAGWELEVAATAARGDDLSRGAPLRRIPPAFVSASLVRDQPAFWWRVRLAAAAAQRRIAPDDASDLRIGPLGTNGWWMLDLAGGRHLGAGVDLELFAENLFDRHYRLHGSGIDAAGFNLGVRAAWKF